MKCEKCGRELPKESVAATPAERIARLTADPECMERLGWPEGTTARLLASEKEFLAWVHRAATPDDAAALPVSATPMDADGYRNARFNALDSLEMAAREERSAILDGFAQAVRPANTTLTDADLDAMEARIMADIEAWAVSNLDRRGSAEEVIRDTFAALRSGAAPRDTRGEAAEILALLDVYDRAVTIGTHVEEVAARENLVAAILAAAPSTGAAPSEETT